MKGVFKDNFKKFIVIDSNFSWTVFCPRRKGTMRLTSYMYVMYTNLWDKARPEHQELHINNKFN